MNKVSRGKQSKPGKKSSTRKTETPAFDQPKEVRAIARERIGTVKPGQVIIPKGERKKPKHKKPLDLESELS